MRMYDLFVTGEKPYYILLYISWCVLHRGISPLSRFYSRYLIEMQRYVTSFSKYPTRSLARPGINVSELIQAGASFLYSGHCRFVPRKLEFSEGPISISIMLTSYNIEKIG